MGWDCLEDTVPTSQIVTNTGAKSVSVAMVAEAGRGAKHTMSSLKMN